MKHMNKKTAVRIATEISALFLALVLSVIFLSPEISYAKTSDAMPYNEAIKNKFAMIEFIDTEIDSIIQNFNLDGLPDVDKIAIVYEYIINNFELDEEYDGIDTYQGNATYAMYSALSKKKAVNQGVTELFARFMDEIDIENEIITSDILGISWNTVKLDGKYYYIDATQDLGRKKSRYSEYFLRGQKDFWNHQICDTQYKDASYAVRHPLSEYMYNDVNILGYLPESHMVQYSTDDIVSIRQESDKYKIFLFFCGYSEYYANIVKELNSQKYTNVEIIYYDTYVYNSDEELSAEKKKMQKMPAIKNGDYYYSYKWESLLNILLAEDIFKFKDHCYNGNMLVVVTPDNQIIYLSEDVPGYYLDVIKYYTETRAGDVPAYKEHTGDHEYEDLYNVIPAPTAESAGKTMSRCSLCGKIGYRIKPSTKNTITGQCGDKAYWSFNCKTKKLTISGKGALWSFDYSDLDRTGWVVADSVNGNYSTECDTFINTEAVEAIEIGEGITNLAAHSLSLFGNVDEIVLPESIKKVGEGAISSTTTVYFTGDKIKLNGDYLPNYVYWPCKWGNSSNIKNQDGSNIKMYHNFKSGKCTWCGESSNNIKYTVRLYVPVKENSYTRPVNLKCKYGKTYKLPKVTEKFKCLTFKGWTTKDSNYRAKSFADGGKIKNLTSQNGDIVYLYPIIEPKTYKITYKLNGGINDLENPSEYKYQEGWFLLKNPKRAGYTFVGWYSDKKMTKKVTRITTVEGKDITLYAKWKRK